MPASAGQAEVLLLFGGDGTVHRHLGQLVRLGLPVLIVPAGSGNDFARALGLRSVRDSLAAWQKFRAGNDNVKTIDLGVISSDQTDSSPRSPGDPSHNSGRSTRFFCCVAGVGLDGEIARRANHLPRWLRGHGGYLLSLPLALFRFAPLPMKILTSVDAPGSSWTIRSDQPTMLAALANTPVYGGGMKIAPLAKMDDGLLDVCVIGGINPFKLFCLTPTVYFGRHLRIREVEYFQAPRLRLESEHPLDVYADGEFVCRTPVEAGVERDALKVLTS